MPRQCQHCHSDEASVRLCDKRILCESCKHGEFKLVTKTTAIQEYGLTPDVLSRLECYEVPSPYYRSRSMYLYLQREVQSESPSCLEEKKRRMEEKRKRGEEKRVSKEMARKSREDNVLAKLGVGFPYTPELRGYLQSNRPGFRRAVDAEIVFRGTPEFTFFEEANIEITSECGKFYRGPGSRDRGTCLILGKDVNNGVVIVDRKYDSQRTIVTAFRATNDLPYDIQHDIMTKVVRHEKQRAWEMLSIEEQRTHLLKDALAHRGMSLRSDSRLCREWIEQGVVHGYNLPSLTMTGVVRVMDQMRFIHNHPIAYERYRQAIRDIKEAHREMHTWYTNDDVSREAADRVCEDWDLDRSMLPIEFR